MLALYAFFGLSQWGYQCASWGGPRTLTLALPKIRLKQNMPKLVCGFRDGEFDEEKGQKREDGGLEEPNEYLEHHERHGKKVGRKVNGDGDDYLAGEDV